MSRGLGDVYKRQVIDKAALFIGRKTFLIKLIYLLQDKGYHLSRCSGVYKDFKLATLLTEYKREGKLNICK